jgi:hypothetical protein
MSTHQNGPKRCNQIRFYDPFEVPPISPVEPLPIFSVEFHQMCFYLLQNIFIFSFLKKIKGLLIFFSSKNPHRG